MEAIYRCGICGTEIKVQSIVKDVASAVRFMRNKEAIIDKFNEPPVPYEFHEERDHLGIALLIGFKDWPAEHQRKTHRLAHGGFFISYNSRDKIFKCK